MSSSIVQGYERTEAARLAGVRHFFLPSQTAFHDEMRKAGTGVLSWSVEENDLGNSQQGDD